MPKPLFLWAHQRSLSTAFERIMIARGDLTVLHELFTNKYSKGNDVPTENEGIKAFIKAELAKSSKRVFIKDMAYHADMEDKNFLGLFQHTFIIRKPEKVLPSYYLKYPEASNHALGYEGYEGVETLYNIIFNLTGKRPILIDADDLEADPEGIIRAYCTATGLDFKPESMHWETGPQPGWHRASNWHVEAVNTTSIHKSTGNPANELKDNPEYQEWYNANIDTCRESYERMTPHRLHPEAAPAENSTPTAVPRTNSLSFI